MRRLTTLLCVIVVCGCAVGPRTKKFGPLTTAAGVHASLQLRDGSPLAGELLAVEDSSLLLLSGGRVTRVAEAGIRSGDFDGTHITITDGRPSSAAGRKKLALFSRFPQGLSPSLLKDLLAAYGQAEVVVTPPQAATR